MFYFPKDETKELIYNQQPGKLGQKSIGWFTLTNIKTTNALEMSYVAQDFLTKELVMVNILE